MHAIRVQREAARPVDLEGRVLCHELRATDGHIAIAKGRLLDAADAAHALELPWSELHLIALDDGDVHEEVAGDRIARLVAGTGVTVGAQSGGHWPLTASHRGLLSIDTTALERINDLDGPCVYSLYDGQVVDAGEVVGRAKIVPFAIGAGVLADVEALVAGIDGVLRVRPFLPHRVGAVVHDSLGARAIGRFRDAVTEKLSWFGSTLCAVETTPSTVDAIARALAVAEQAGAEIVLVAGTKAMDLLDPTFAALEHVGARMVRHGVPAHPGSLLWLADWNGRPIVGMPTCGLFAQATVFDLVIARLLTGERPSRRDLARVAEGGLLTKALAFKLPPYRTTVARGAVE